MKFSSIQLDRINSLFKLTRIEPSTRNVALNPVGKSIIPVFNEEKEYYVPWLYSYEENIFGFRSDEFKNKIDFVALGCSHTYGVGMPKDLTWPNFFSELTGMKNYANLGKPGASIQEQVRTLYSFVSSYNPPRAVVCNFPGFSRYETVEKSGKSVQGSVLDARYKHFSMDLMSVFHQNIQAIHNLETICKAYGIKLVWQSWASLDDVFVEHYRVSSSYYRHNDEMNYWGSIHWATYFDKVSGNLQFKPDTLRGMSCCSELKEKSNSCFLFAFDRFNVPRQYISNTFNYSKNEVMRLMATTDPVNGSADTSNLGHLGAHAHYHWARNLASGL